MRGKVYLEFINYLPLSPNLAKMPNAAAGAAYDLPAARPPGCRCQEEQSTQGAVYGVDRFVILTGPKTRGKGEIILSLP